MCGGRAQRDGGLGTDGGRAGRGAQRQTGTRGNRNKTGTQTQLPIMSALCCRQSLSKSLREGKAGSLAAPSTQALQIIAVWPVGQ